MMARWRIILVILLSLLAAGVSGLLLLQHHGERRATAAVREVCGEGQADDCEAVNRSAYSEVRGVPLAAVGLFFYLCLALLLFLASLAGPETRDAAAALAKVALVLSLAVDVVLLGVQAVALRAFCRLCLLTYALGAMALVALFPARRDSSVVGQAVSRPDGRLVFAGWLTGALALAAAVASAELALSYRGRTRVAAILGSPAPPSLAAAPVVTAAPASPAAPGSEIQRYQEEARLAQEQARRLQEILDDPKKLERHFAEKAAREFEQGTVHVLDLKGVAFKGPANAPIRVVEYSDFLCPYCRSIAGAFASFLPQSGDRLAVYYKNYPLDQACNVNVKAQVHPGSCWLALGALCAHEQNRFWPYHDKVFGSDLKDPQLKDAVRLGSEVGLDPAALESCIASPRAKERLDAEIAEAHKVGVAATPTLFINGKRLPRVNDFIPMLEKESARLGLPPLPGAAPR